MSLITPSTASPAAENNRWLTVPLEEGEERCVFKVWGCGFLEKPSDSHMSMLLDRFEGGHVRFSTFAVQFKHVSCETFDCFRDEHVKFPLFAGWFINGPVRLVPIAETGMRLYFLMQAIIHIRVTMRISVRTESAISDC